MPVVACPDCHREISDAAPACPGCGRPMLAPAAVPAQPSGTVVTRRAGGAYEAIGTVLVVGGMLICCAHPIGFGIAGVGLIVFLVGRFM